MSSNSNSKMADLEFSCTTVSRGSAMLHDRQRMFSLGEPVPALAARSGSWLTRVEPEEVFCCCSPSTLLRCFFAHRGSKDCLVDFLSAWTSLAMLSLQTAAHWMFLFLGGGVSHQLYRLLCTNSLWNTLTSPSGTINHALSKSPRSRSASGFWQNLWFCIIVTQVFVSVQSLQYPAWILAAITCRLVSKNDLLVTGGKQHTMEWDHLFSLSCTRWIIPAEWAIWMAKTKGGVIYLKAIYSGYRKHEGL